jgi:hypothetical protein
MPLSIPKFKTALCLNQKKRLPFKMIPLIAIDGYTFVRKQYPLLSVHERRNPVCRGVILTLTN